jgi:hypothetical protein
MRLDGLKLWRRGAFDAMKTMLQRMYGYGWRGIVHSEHALMRRVFENLQQWPRHAGVVAHDDRIFGGAP